MVTAVAHNAECGWPSDVGVQAARTPPMRVADNALRVQCSVQPDQRALTAVLPRCWSGTFSPISSSHRCCWSDRGSPRVTPGAQHPVRVAADGNEAIPSGVRSRPDDRASEFLRRRETRTRCRQATCSVTPINQRDASWPSNERSTTRLYVANTVAPMPCRRRVESD